MKSFCNQILIICSIALLGCEPWDADDLDPVPGSLSMQVALEWNDEPYAVGDVAEDHLGHPVRIDNLQCYIAPIEFREKDGEWITIDDVFLIDFSEHNPTIVAALPAGSYDAFRMGLGIPPEINTDIDPASYPNDHPLSVLGSAGMFWTWASGYIFVKYEGKFALESGSQLIEPLSYHCGTDESYRTVLFEWDEPLAIESHEATASILTLDAANALIGVDESIDIALNPVTHNASGDSLGSVMMNLLDDAWTWNLLP